MMLLPYAYVCLVASLTCFLLALRFLRKSRPRPSARKHVTMVAPPSAESFCAHCRAFVVHERFATWHFCPKCGGPLSGCTAVDAQPTPEEETTLPTGKDAA